MKISVRNYRRVERADIEGRHIIVVAGRNQQGKTSLLQATALCATGRGVPASHLKKQAGELVHAGGEGGHVEVVFDFGSQRVTYPKIEIQSDGVMPHVSAVAAGLVDPTALSPDEFAKLLSSIIPGATPTLKDLTEAFADMQVPEKIAKSVWEIIESDGWDAALAKAAATGAGFKARFEDVTGRKWGARVAEDWRPEGWRDELASQKVEDLRAGRSDLVDALEKAIGAAAVDEHEMARLESMAEAPEETAASIEEAKAKVAELEASVEAARQARNAIGDLPSGSEMNCPSCGTMLRFNRIAEGVTKLEEIKERISEKERKALVGKIAAADGTQKRLEGELSDWRRRLVERKQVYTNQLAAIEQLTALRQKAGGSGTKADVDAARAALAAMDADIAAIEKFTAARKIHLNILNNTGLRELLEQGGLRKTVLARAVKAFNADQVAPVWQAAKWPPVVIEPDLSVTYDGFPLRNVEGSGLWMARVVLQVAIARAEDSALVIVDGADVLDEKAEGNIGNRNRMFTMFHALKLTALVSMTVASPATISHLGKIPIVSPFWIDDGRTQPLAEALSPGGM